MRCSEAAQSCRLASHRHYDGNVVLEVTSSRPLRSTSRQHQVALYYIQVIDAAFYSI